MSLAEATPSSSTRHASTSALSVNRSTSASALVSVPVLIEAPAGLGAEIPGGHQRSHLGMDVEALAVALGQVLGDVHHGVEPEHVGQEEGTGRSARRLGEEPVELLDVQP